MKKSGILSNNVNEKIVEVFKTDVAHEVLAKKIIANLNQLYPRYKINFDLEDCDRILRIESPYQFNVDEVLNHVKNYNVHIEFIDY